MYYFQRGSKVYKYPRQNEDEIPLPGGERCSYTHSPKAFVSLTSNTGIYLLITVVDCFSGVEFVPIEDQQVFEVEGATLTAIHTPGHTTDHVVLHLKVSYRYNRKQTNIARTCLYRLVIWIFNWSNCFE